MTTADPAAWQNLDAVADHRQRLVTLNTGGDSAIEAAPQLLFSWTLPPARRSRSGSSPSS